MFAKMSFYDSFCMIGIFFVILPSVIIFLRQVLWSLPSRDFWGKISLRRIRTCIIFMANSSNSGWKNWLLIL